MMKTFYEQTNFPVLQNRVYETREAAINCPKGEIKIVEDTKTGLVYNASFDPELMMYDENYNNEQGVSPSFQQHLSQVADLIEGTLGRQNLVEVGCGKGFFFEMLLKRGFDLIGCDATYDGNNPKVTKKNFEPGIIAMPAKGLILRHVLEHIPDPYDFLCQLRDANGGGGLIYIEVPCFDWILRKRAWFDIFYEHVNYFRLNDFDRMFGRVIKSGRFFGDQYLYVVADLASLQEPAFDQSDSVDFPSDFLQGLNSEEQNRTEQNRTEQNRTEQNTCLRLGWRIERCHLLNAAAARWPTSRFRHRREFSQARQVSASDGASSFVSRAGISGIAA